MSKEIALSHAPSWRDTAVTTFPFLVALPSLVIMVDQLVKALVTEKLKSGRVVELLGGLVRLDYTSNTGAAFGFFRSGSIVFAVIAGVVSVAIIGYYRKAAESPVVVRTALGLILGGAVGNLIDRVRLGYVVDFIDVRVWPVFNLADSAIVLGVTLLLAHALMRPSIESA